MGEKTKVRLDQSRPGEIALILSFALFLVLIIGLVLG
jgi:hypothetical protein